MPAQRNTKQPLVKEQRNTKPKAPPPAQSASTPIIRVRSPTPPKLLALIELDARDPHRENGLRRLSPQPKHRLAVPKRSRGKAEKGRPSDEELPLSGMPKISQKGTRNTQARLGAEHVQNANERGPSAKADGTWKVQGTHLVSGVPAPSVSRSTESVPAVLHTSRGSPLV